MQDAQEEGTRAASMEEAECFEALKQNLLPSATQFASELNITKEDLGVNDGGGGCGREKRKKPPCGWGFFVTHKVFSKKEEETQTRGGSFKDCFIEATGIGAGVALVAGLSKASFQKLWLRPL